MTGRAQFRSCGAPRREWREAAPPATLAAARGLRRQATPQQRRLWGALRRLRPDGFAFRRQAPLTGFVVHFACLKHRLVVEVEDGPPDPTEAAGGSQEVRDAALASAGFRVLRFFPVEIDRDLDGVMRTVAGQLHAVG